MSYADGPAPTNPQPQPQPGPRIVERGNGASVVWPQPSPPTEPVR